MSDYKHNTDISCEVVLTLEDNLDNGKIPQTKHYKVLCKYIPQDFLDNFLSWFGQECIERYTNKVLEHIDEDKLNELAQESLNNKLKFSSAPHVSEFMKNDYVGGFKAGYQKALNS